MFTERYSCKLMVLYQDCAAYILLPSFTFVTLTSEHFSPVQPVQSDTAECQYSYVALQCCPLVIHFIWMMQDMHTLNWLIRSTWHHWIATLASWDDVRSSTHCSAFLFEFSMAITSRHNNIITSLATYWYVERDTWTRGIVSERQSKRTDRPGA